MLNKITFDKQDISLFQDNVDLALIPLQTAPLSGGTLLSNIGLTSGQDNLISHSLGYAPTIIVIGCPNVDTRVWSPTTSSLSGSNVSTTTINLRCSTTCIVSVFLK